MARVFREAHGRAVAVLIRRLGDVGLAEEAVQDAFAEAMARWPQTGLPPSPAGWIVTTARNRAIDRVRREAMRGRRHAEAAWLDAPGEPPAEEEDVEDERLRLIFTCCHPSLALPARVALTLRLLGGLTTAEIARAFLVPEPTIAQRIVRAKRTLSAARVPFEVPQAEARAERLDSVLEVIYLVFNEGYAATAGEDWMRPALCEEALRLGRVLAGLAPAEPEVHGLVALMELQASRLPARLDAQGRPVLLAAQDRARWDRLLIHRGLAALARAEADGAPGPYALQAAIAACHARAAQADATDWARIVALYDALLRQAPSPVVALNRAVAVGMAEGPAAGLALVEPLAGEPALRDYPWLHSVRGDLLQRLQRRDEAVAAFSQALALSHNEHDRWLLQRRLQQLGDVSPPAR